MSQHQAYTLTNKHITEINKLVKNYFNMFILDQNNEIFTEMRNIGSDRADTIPSAGLYTVQMFNKFIDSVINNNISSDAVSGYGTNTNNGMIKIKSGNNGFVVADLPNLKFVFACMNIINVFVDILDAYKYFIDNEPNFKEYLKKINKIVLVPSTHRKQEHLMAGSSKTVADIPNIGYHIDASDYDTMLFLAIKSYTSSHINKIFSSDTVTDTANGNKSLATNGLFEGTELNFSLYVNQLADNSDKDNFKINVSDTISANYLTENVSLEDFQKRALNYFLKFLAQMNDDNTRIQVNALYFYYKYVQLYIILVFSTMNIVLNNSASDTQSLMKIIQYTPNTAGTGVSSNEVPPSTPYASNDAIFEDISGKTTVGDFTYTINSATANKGREHAATIYDNAVRHVQTNLTKLVGELYSLNIPTAFENNMIIRNDLSMKATYYSGDKIKLDFGELSGIVAVLNAIISDGTKKPLLQENHVISYAGKVYDIVLLESNYIYIRARFPNNNEMTYDAIPEFEPPNWSTLSSSHNDTTSIYIITVQIVPKGLVALRQEYRQGKIQLRDINEDIRYNTSKINSQKNMFEYEQNKDTLLRNQTYTYTVIIGLIVLAILVLQIIKVDQSTKEMAGMVFGGIIVIFFIVYYIINSTYMEEFKMKEGFFAISKPSDLPTASNTDKKDFLQLQIDSTNIRFIEYFQKVMIFLPVSESVDFYYELNSVIKSEKNDKTNIKEILEFKRSYGNSSIDVMRYENNNQQIFLSTLLVSALLFIILYNVAIYSPSEYTNLIMFAGFIFAIIIFAYYLIFSSKTVRNRSNNKYWGPEFNKNM